MKFPTMILLAVFASAAAAQQAATSIERVATDPGGPLITVQAVGHSATFADTDGLLIEYDFHSDGPVDNDPTPLVRVYGDGRLEVAMPWYRRDAGFYQGWLSASELDQLLSEIEQTQVPLMDPEDLRHRKMLTKSAAETVVASSETETTRFSFALAGARTMAESSWRNLRLDVRTVGKSVDEYSRLWRVDRMLHQLTQHPSLRKVAEMPAAARENKR